MGAPRAIAGRLPVGLVFVIHQDAAIDGVYDDALTTMVIPTIVHRDRLATWARRWIGPPQPDDRAAGFDFMADGLTVPGGLLTQLRAM
jgi:hypothetical protein